MSKKKLECRDEVQCLHKCSYSCKGIIMEINRTNDYVRIVTMAGGDCSDMTQKELKFISHYTGKDWWNDNSGDTLVYGNYGWAVTDGSARGRTPETMHD